MDSGGLCHPSGNAQTAFCLVKLIPVEQKIERSIFVEEISQNISTKEKHRSTFVLVVFIFCCCLVLNRQKAI